MKMTEKIVTPAYVTEMIWNGGDSGTAVCGDGTELKVGTDDGGWSSEYLLLLAAETSLMTSVLAAARDSDLQVLGYVSSGHLEMSDDPAVAPRLTVRPCLVVGSSQDAERAAVLLTAAATESIIGRLLGERLQVGLDVRLE
jgi:hypothetical protein